MLAPGWRSLIGATGTPALCWPAARIGAERLAVLRDQRRHRFEPVVLDEAQMLGEPLVAADAVFGTADRPEDDHAAHPLRMRHAERHHRRAAHATAHEVSALD